MPEYEVASLNLHSIQNVSQLPRFFWEDIPNIQGQEASKNAEIGNRL